MNGFPNSWPTRTRITAAGLLCLALTAATTTLNADTPPATPAAAELALLAPIAASGVADADTQRFLEAEKALRAGRLSTFRRLAGQLEHHPLYPYLAYGALNRRLAQAKAADIDAFLSRFADSPLSERLRRRWLEVLARRDQWHDFLRYYVADAKRVALHCQYLRGLIQTGQKQDAFGQVAAVWLSGDSRPKTCDPVFKAWREADGLTRALVWERVGLAMERGNTGLARYLSRYLSKADRPLAAQWIALRKSPHQVKKIAQTTGEPLYERMEAYAVKRLARKDADAAVALWSYLSSRRTHAADIANAVFREIGLAYARAGNLDGSEWLLRIPPQSRDRHSDHWLLANAALHGRWQQALDASTAPSNDTADPQQQRYWQARSLEALGRASDAQAIYRTLAGERHFYGFLAADRIGAPYAFGDQPIAAEESALIALAAEPAGRRIRLLRALDRMLDARREWYFWMRTLDEGQRTLAAKLAQRWGWHDAGILTIARTPHRDDLELRFPLAYAREAARQAGDQGLEQAMVMALIRQESAFMADATSPKGARGLMQLMPATGRHVARSLGTRLKGRNQLYDPALNLRLGTAYFRRMLDVHAANPVLALGAYNAGPRRITQWRKRFAPADSDVWVENIVFSETREYVKRVLAYTAVYEYRLGLTPTALSHRMGTISPP